MMTYVLFEIVLFAIILYAGKRNLLDPTPVAIDETASFAKKASESGRNIVFMMPPPGFGAGGGRGAPPPADGAGFGGFYNGGMPPPMMGPFIGVPTVLLGRRGTNNGDGIDENEEEVGYTFHNSIPQKIARKFQEIVAHIRWLLK